jgi:DNA-binding LytR/AlgR family response regulator
MLQSENANESLRISADAILFIASADNYVEVHFLEERQLKRKLLRNSLRAIAAQTTSAQSFWRCHKSYLVNLDRVVKTSGNAQGYKLHFLETDQSIPVSRAFNTELKQRLSN